MPSKVVLIFGASNEDDWLEELLFVVVEMAQMKRVVLFTLWTGSRFERESSLMQTTGEFLSRIWQIFFHPLFFLPKSLDERERPLSKAGKVKKSPSLHLH